MISSRHFLTYFTLSAICTISTWTLWILYRGALPQLVPFDYLHPWGQELVATNTLWRLPFYMTAGVALTTLIAGWYWQRERLYSQLILSTISFINIIALLSMLKVVLTFT